MHSRISLNYRLSDATRARRASAINAAAATLDGGRGVFTTLAIHHAQPFLWDAHWRRLQEHAARLNVSCRFVEEEVKSALARLIEANEVETGRARIMLHTRDRSVALETERDGEAESDLLLMTDDARIPTPDDTLALSVSPYRANTLSPLSGIKCTSYLEHLLRWEEARARDFDEAVVLNERGEVVSASLANIFWIMRGTLHTPALQTGALEGTTRACVIRLAEELSVPLVEGATHLHDLAEADEIFLTSASLGVSLVTTFDFHRYTISAGSVALRLHEAFRQLTLSGS